MKQSHLIEHVTHYSFSDMPISNTQRLHLTPMSNRNQSVKQWTLELEGASIEFETEDYHGNTIHIASFDGESDTVRIRAKGVVEVTSVDGVYGAHDNMLPLHLYTLPTPATTIGANLRAIAARFSGDGRKPLDHLHTLSNHILEHMPYQIGATDAYTTAEKAAEIGFGVCQDHVHSFLALARSDGFPARYVSGYLMAHTQGEVGVSHAWAEVFVEGLGWVGFDVSNAISPDQNYVRLASGFEYTDVMPVAGVRFGPGAEILSTFVTVQ